MVFQVDQTRGPGRIKEENMPKVSVIVPTYNVEQYLEECMESLVNQTLRDMEFVCVNDGSTDYSLDILKKYAAKDARVRILDGPNGGYGKAMNRGLDACTGEYVGIVEPDDYVKTDMYEKLYQIARKKDLEIVKADFYRFVEGKDGKQVFTYNRLTPEDSMYDRVLDPKEDVDVFKAVMNTWSGIYKRSFLIENHIRHNETPGASFQDNGFWFQTFCYTKRLWFVGRPYYRNRRDNPNSSVHSREKVFCMNDEYAFIREFLDTHPVFKERYLAIYHFRRYHNYVASLYRVGEEYKDIYMERFQREFMEADENGELEASVFTPKEWELVQILLKDRHAYVYEERIYRVGIEKDWEIERLQRELENVENSTSYKVGKAVMFLPCVVKEWILRMKRDHE